MKIHQIFSLCLKGIWKRNLRSRILLGIVLILTAIPVVMYSVSSSLLDFVSLEKASVYGSFQYILWDTQTKNDASVLLPIDEWDFTGTMIVTDHIRLDSGKIISLGYADQNALTLGDVQLEDGSFPKHPDEIALTRAVLNELAPHAVCGDSVTLNQTSYQLSGIVRDYGRLWVREEPQIKKDMNPVSAFTVSDTAVCRYRILLVHAPFGQVIHNTSDAFLVNINAASGNETYYQIPVGFYILFLICSFLILYHLMIFSRNHLNKRIYVYQLCGMTHAEILGLFWTETGLISLIGVLLGMIAGNFFGFALSAILCRQTNAAPTWKICSETFVAGIHIFVLSLFSQQLFFWFEDDRKKRPSTEKSSRPARKTTWLRLLLLDLKKSQKGILAAVILSSSLLSVLLYTCIYDRFFISASSHKELDGKMPFDYDYEIAAEAGTATTPEITDDEWANIVYTSSSYEWNGLSEDTLNQLKAIPGIESVYGYREDSRIWVLMPEDQMDTYLDLSDLSSDQADGIYQTSWPQALDSEFQYDPSLIKVQSKLYGYPEEELEKMKAYISDGTIDYDKLRTGEDVILMAPAVLISAVDNHGISRKRVSPQTEGAAVNTAWHAGDLLTFTEIQTTQPVDGWIMKEDAATLCRRIDRTVRIAAVIPYHVGWFENDISIGDVYTLVTINDAIDALALNAAYSRVRIYLAADADASAVKSEIYNCISAYPYVTLADYQSELKGYHEMNFFIRLFTSILSILVVLASLICFHGQMISRLKVNQKTYLLLKINGMNNWRLYSLWIAESLLTGISGILLTAPILSAAVQLSFANSIPELIQTYQVLTPSDVIRSIGILFSLLFLAFLSACFCFRHRSLREEILQE